MCNQDRSYGRNLQFSKFDPVILLDVGANPQKLLETLNKDDCDWKKVPLFERDQALGALYASVFGDEIASRVKCAGCEQYYQMDFQIWELMASVLEDRAKAPKNYHLPNVQMLNEAVGDESILLDLMFEGKSGAPKAGDAEFWVKVEKQNPILDLDIDSLCPNCEHLNWTRYSHVHFFAKRLQMTLAALLDEIHLLASTYTWSKVEIYDLSADVRGGFAARIRQMISQPPEHGLGALRG